MDPKHSQRHSYLGLLLGPKGKTVFVCMCVSFGLRVREIHLRLKLQMTASLYSHGESVPGNNANIKEKKAKKWRTVCSC